MLNLFQHPSSASGHASLSGVLCGPPWTLKQVQGDGRVVAGANSIFTGDKLLTAGDSADAALFAKLGLTPLAGEEPMRAAAK